MVYIINFGIKPTEENILFSIVNDTVGRNKEMVSFLQIIKKLPSNTVLSIDNNWGSGKTFFVKQLDYIINHSNSEDPKIKQIINDSKLFEDSFKSIYYNAFENDFHSNPILSLIYQLLNDFKKDLSVSAIKEQTILQDIAKITKLFTCGTIDFTDILDIESLTDEIVTVEETKECLGKIFEELIVEKANKLIIFIDELDRCKPDFAIKMLEGIKTFFENDKLIFVFSTNSEQLAHTIRKFYGNDFDGERYLQKFFDLNFSLKKVNVFEYINSFKYIEIKNNSKWFDISLKCVVSHFKFSLRDCDKFLTFLNVIDYKDIQNAEPKFYFINTILIPFVVGLKISDPKKYKLFEKGSYAPFLEYIDQNAKIKEIISNSFNKERNIEEAEYKYNEKDIMKILDFLYRKSSEEYIEIRKSLYFGKTELDFFESNIYLFAKIY